jgi:hypothetical protein
VGINLDSEWPCSDVFTLDIFTTISITTIIQRLIRIPAAARPKVWVCGRLLAGTVGSNPAEAMDVLSLVSICVVM